jgi:methylmalonyl-CoA mutase N-terminal domain/subunit
MMKEEFGARDPRSLAVNIASHTSGLSMTAQQPVNNIMRGATQALALALAGVQGIEISAFDEAYRTPSPESHVVALRTQHIIGLESNVTRVADPLGGSWYVEALTDEIERRIGERVARIESMGDPAALCDDGYFRQVFLRAMERYGQEVRSGERPVVGVNRFPMPAGEDTLLREMTERKIEPWRDWIETIRTWKKGRDLGAVRGALAVARNAAADPGAELLGPIIAALEADATTGEIAAAMRQACGLPGDPYGKTAAAP